MNSKYKETEIGLIPEEWELVSLENLIDIKHGFAFKGKFFSEEECQNILLTPGNFKIGGGFNDSKFKYYTGEIPEDYILKKDDIIVTMTDLSKEGDTLGYTAKIPFSHDKKYLHNQRLGLLKFKSNEVTPEFLYWKLRNHDYRHLVLATASGTTVKHTSPSRILKIEIALPTLNEQEKIAKILSDIDKKIEINQKMNQTLEEIGHAIFKRWFVHFEFPNDEGKPYKSSTGEMVDSELGEIPNGWEIIDLEQYISKIVDNRGKTPPLSSDGRKLLETYQVFLDEPFPDFKKESKQKYVSEETYENWFRSGHPQYLDILFATVGNGIPKWCFVPKNCDFCIAQNIVALRVKKDLSTFYLKYTFNNHYFLEQLDGRIIDTARPSIRMKHLMEIKVLMPSNHILNKFDSIIGSLYFQMDINDKIIENLTDVRDSLLPKLMSGKIRVPLEEK